MNILKNVFKTNTLFKPFYKFKINNFSFNTQINNYSYINEVMTRPTYISTQIETNIINENIPTMELKNKTTNIAARKRRKRKFKRNISLRWR